MSAESLASNGSISTSRSKPEIPCGYLKLLTEPNCNTKMPCLPRKHCTDIVTTKYRRRYARKLMVSLKVESKVLCLRTWYHYWYLSNSISVHGYCTSFSTQHGAERLFEKLRPYRLQTNKTVVQSNCDQMRQEWVCTPWYLPLISSPMAAWAVDFQLIISERIIGTAQERNLNLQWQPTHHDLVSMPICAGFLSSTITHKFRQLISRVSKHGKVLNPNIAVTVTNAPYFQPQTLMYGDWLGEDPPQQRCLSVPLVVLFSFPET